MIKWLKKIFFISLALGIICFLGSLWANVHVKSHAEKKMFDKTSKIPKNRVGLVLGTSKYMVGGGINGYFKHRMDAAYQLYKNKKVDRLIVSGDNHKKGYNEPQQMKDYLVDLGVKEDHIYLDYAGFRTFDSMIRAKEIFGQDTLTIISQKFHNERALFICESVGVEAVAYNAKMPYFTKRMRIREYLAKCKAVLDIYLLRTKPKFLGEKIEIR